MSPSPGAVALNYVDRGCIAVMDAERGCPNAPTWELRVRGALDPQHARIALGDLLQRHPSCRARVCALEPTRALHAVPQNEWDLDRDRLFRFVDLAEPGAPSLAALRDDIRDRPIDPCQEIPMQLTLARVSADESRLFFHWHHSIGDGRTSIAFMTEFGEFLECARQGERPPPEKLRPYGKCDERVAFGIGRARAWLWGLAGLGIWIRMAFRLWRRPITLSFQNRSPDFRGSQASTRCSFEAKWLDDWKARRGEHGISPTALISAAIFLANHRWNRELGVQGGRTRLGVVAELRGRERRVESGGNHIGGLFLDLDMGVEPTALEMMRSLHAQLSRQVRRREPEKRLLFERTLLSRIPLDTLRNLAYVSDPTVNLNLSNLVPIDMPRLEGRGWCADALWLTTPILPPYGVMTSAIRYNGVIRISFCYKTSVVRPEQAERLTGHFETAMRELCHAAHQAPPEISCES